MGRGKNRKRSLRRWLRYQYLNLVRIDDTPEKIAWGMALGVFLGFFPTFGLGIILAVVLSAYFHINKVAAVLGTFVMNPWTSPIVWTGSYLLGAHLLNLDIAQLMADIRDLKAAEASLETWTKLLAADVLWPYLLGNFLISVGSAVLFYYLTLWGVRTYRRIRGERRARQSVGHSGRGGSL
ncbi:MAG: DUF2062 domain-containing protein [Nitrospirae bacterium]|nr:DUF2062 domain-containing protein [Nitrospirota bacterium]